jgi:hypothetical protein
MLVAMSDVELHPAGPDLGLRALRAAIDRLHEAWTTRGEGDWRISASAGEALLWIAALDNYMVIQDQKRGTGYRTRRDADPLGEVVRALVYARDAFGHGLSMVSSFVYELGSPGIVQGDNVLKEASGPWLTIHFRWASIAKLQTVAKMPRWIASTNSVSLIGPCRIRLTRHTVFSKARPQGCNA